MTPEMQAAMIRMTTGGVLTGLGVLLVVGYLFFARERRSVLYLGLSFVGGGLGEMLRSTPVCWVYYLFGLAMLVMAIRIGISDFNGRILEMRLEQRDRESAFADYLAETTRLEAAQEAALKAEQQHGAGGKA